MAEKRMFSKAIIDSDAFLDMPVSARLLYYDLSMRADDDGFVNSPKKIMRMIGASEDDLRILAVRKFIIPFDSGVVVIKHWRIHNYIRKDTYHETTYKEEKAQLELDENKAYRIPHDHAVDEPSTQIRLDKIRLDKYSEGDGGYINNIQGDPPPPPDPLPVPAQTDIETIIQTWNAQCCTRNIEKIAFGSGRYNNTMLCINGNLPQFLLTIRELDGMAWFAERTMTSDLLNYDWFIKPDNYQKIVEGNYRDARPKHRQETEQERSIRKIMEAKEE